MCIDGATTGPVFLSFLDHFLVPHLWPGAVVIMDNLSAHKAKAVRAKIEAVSEARTGFPLACAADFRSDGDALTDSFGHRGNVVLVQITQLQTFSRQAFCRASSTFRVEVNDEGLRSRACLQRRAGVCGAARNGRQKVDGA